jgi:hypothetical protein
MFDALIPKTDADFGTESYEEVVDNYCAALEDVESEISGLESLSDAIDNADAFAAAIESCGGSVSPALMQFGYSVDPSFGELIGRECPSDFATEDMTEFGSFALESIKSKLKLAWEVVKDFIIRLWEKLKEFGRWIVKLFDRKIQRLEEIAKKKTKYTTDESKALSKSFNEHVFNSALTKSDIEKRITAINGAVANPADPIIVEDGNFRSSGDKGEKIQPVKDKYKNLIEYFGFKINESTGMIVRFKGVASTNKKGSELGLNKLEICNLAENMAKCLRDRNNWESQYKKLDKIKRDCDKQAAAAARAADTYEKTDDDDRREQIKVARKEAILSSRIVVLIGKCTNNVAATIIGYANVAGM